MSLVVQAVVIVMVVFILAVLLGLSAVTTVLVISIALGSFWVRNRYE